MQLTVQELSSFTSCSLFHIPECDSPSSSPPFFFFFFFGGGSHIVMYSMIVVYIDSAFFTSRVCERELCLKPEFTWNWVRMHVQLLFSRTHDDCMLKH